MLFGEIASKKKSDMTVSVDDPELGTDANDENDREMNEDEQKFLDEVKQNDEEIVRLLSLTFSG